MLKSGDIAICIGLDTIIVRRRKYGQPERERTYHPGPDSEARLMAVVNAHSFTSHEMPQELVTRSCFTYLHADVWYWRTNQYPPPEVQDDMDEAEGWDRGVSQRDWLAPRHYRGRP